MAGKYSEKVPNTPIHTTETIKPSSIINATGPLHTTVGSHIVQNYVLFWLDAHIDESVDDFKNSLTQLRQTVNTIHTFTDADCCINFLHEIENEKVVMIVSGELGQHVVPNIHNSTQLDSLFIFCYDRTKHEQWAKEWRKIKGVFIEIIPICEALKMAAQQCEQDAMPMSFMATGGDMSKKNLDQLDSSFMYTTIMKEILLVIKFEQQHFMEFIQYCREALADNEGELKNVKKLERQYRDETPIWWYTYEGFVYPMLNRALRLMDVDIIIKIGFFIGDLHRQIEELHKEQFGGHNSNKRFMVYRGQGMSKSEFEKLTKTKGGLISFNNFLSTSRDREVSLHFTRHALSNPDLVGILFVMAIDPSRSTTPFAAINDVSYFKDKEDEVLFSTHTIFRIGDIKPMGEHHRLFRVELTLTCDNDPDLRVLTDRIREEIDEGSVGFDRMGKFLIKIGQFDKAEEIYRGQLEQAVNDVDSAHFHHMLGHIKDEQGEYDAAFSFYDKSLEIYLKILPSNHTRLATSYNNIGSVYDKMGKYQEALVFYNEALKILKETRPENHPDLATCYINIGLVYNNMGKYTEALSVYEQGLVIDQKTLPPNHPSLAISYINIGLAHYNSGDNSKALQFYEKALEIQKQSLPPNHPDLGTSYNNIGMVYNSMGDYSKARSFYEQAVEIGQQSLPPNHPNLQDWRKNLDEVKKKL